MYCDGKLRTNPDSPNSNGRLYVQELPPTVKMQPLHLLLRKVSQVCSPAMKELLDAMVTKLSSARTSCKCWTKRGERLSHSTKSSEWRISFMLFDWFVFSTRGPITIEVCSISGGALLSATFWNFYIFQTSSLKPQLRTLKVRIQCGSFSIVYHL